MTIHSTNPKPFAHTVGVGTQDCPPPPSSNQDPSVTRQESEKPLCHQNNAASNNTQKNLLSNLTQGANKLNQATKLAASFVALHPDNTLVDTKTRKYEELSVREKVHKAADYVAKVGDIATALIPFVAAGSATSQPREVVVAGLSAIAILGQGANALATATAPKPLRPKPVTKAKL